ncbi:MAG TPA: hypothetical protein VKI99_05345 [Candidatus Dormibacteraeota bacterium]|nr:hypothetical protein [Candidatus Dormibacteraeota bacterium]
MWERVLSEFLEHYHQARPDQGINQRRPWPPADEVLLTFGPSSAAIGSAA